MLEIKSIGKGFLLPRMIRSQIGSISYPEDGLKVYCLTDGNIYIYVALAGELHERGATAIHWTGTRYDNSFAHCLYYDSGESTMGTASKVDGFSVGCIKD